MELFGNTEAKPVDKDVLDIMLLTVEAIESKHMKGITVEIGLGVKAKIHKMAKESIKVERSEVRKRIFEE